MNLLTVYEAFKNATAHKIYCRRVRGSRGGIAVEEDKWALEWQRTNRQAQRFDTYLTQQCKIIGAQSRFVIGSISQQQWNDAVAASKALLQCDKRVYYRNVVAVDNEKEERQRLKITLELYPHGDETAVKKLGEAVIVNDGTGTEELGNYEVTLAEFGDYPGLYRGKIAGFDRKERGPFFLLLEAIEACL